MEDIDYKKEEAVLAFNRKGKTLVTWGSEIYVTTIKSNLHRMESIITSKTCRRKIQILFHNLLQPVLISQYLMSKKWIKEVPGLTSLTGNMTINFTILVSTKLSSILLCQSKVQQLPEQLPNLLSQRHFPTLEMLTMLQLPSPSLWRQVRKLSKTNLFKRSFARILL